jgi:hypothetical protein
LPANVSQLFRLRININDLDLVNDPVAARQQTAAAMCIFSFHLKAAVCAPSELKEALLGKRFFPPPLSPAPAFPIHSYGSQ